MQDILSWFGEEGLAPHGFCLLWQPRLVALHVISDAIVGVSYYVIPFALAYFVKRRTDLAFGWIFWMFAVFILACGTTHFFDIWVLWHPDYAAQGLVKAFTAAASLSTAIVIWPLVPRALALPSVAQYRKATAAVSAAERNLALEIIRKSEDRVRLLTSELGRKPGDSGARLATLIDRLPNAAVYQIVVQGDRWYYAYVSKGIERVRGVSADAVLADPMLLIRQVLPQYLPALETAEKAAKANLAPFEHEFEARLPSGEVRWLQLSSAPHRLSNGAVAWNGIQLDITDRKRTEEHQQLMRMMP